MGIPNKTISQFKTQLAGGGARPNLFEVQLNTFPETIRKSWTGEGGPAKDFTFFAKATALPAQNIAAIDVPFRGRTFKVAGDRTIDNWTVTIINDESFNIRNAFEEWSELIAKLDTNLGATNPSSYMVDAYVYQLGRGEKILTNSKSNAGSENAILKAYQFDEIFPVTVGDIALSYESGDTIEEFDVEFAVQSIRRSAAGDLGTGIQTIS